MQSLATLLGLAMLTVQLASRLRVDMDHNGFTADARKAEGLPGDSHWGRSPWQPHSAPQKMQLDSDVVIKRPFSLTSPTAWAATVVTALPWRSLFAGQSRRLPKDIQWQPRRVANDTSQVSEVSTGFAAHPSEVEVNLALANLDEALAAPGASERKLLVQSRAALTAVVRAVYDTQAAWNAMMEASTEDTDATVFETRSKTFQDAVVTAKALMDDAWAALEILLQACVESAMPDDQAESRNVQIFEGLIIMAKKSMEEARDRWWNETTQTEIASGIRSKRLQLHRQEIATHKQDAKGTTILAGKAQSTSQYSVVGSDPERK